MKNKILLNPGPTNTSHLTKMAQMEGSDVCHRTEAFYEVLKETKALLLERFLLGTSNEDTANWHIALIGGSGTVAMEAMVSSLAHSKGCHIVVAGKYGLRMKEMMQIYDIEEQLIKAKNIDDLVPNDAIEQLFFVENETTTGEKFELTKMAKKYSKANFFVDATAAFGASHYGKAIKQIAAISFCSNKCLQSTPGLGIVIWRKHLPIFQRNYYSYLSKYIPLIPPFTIPVQSVYALRAALQGSGDNTNLFFERSQRLIKDLKQENIKCINKYPCNSIIGFTHPTKSYEELRQYLMARDIVIYSGIEGITNSFRLATMSVDFDKYYHKIIKILYESIH